MCGSLWLWQSIMKRIGVSDNRSGPILHQVDSAATCLPMNLNIDDQKLFHSILNLPIMYSFHAITFSCYHYHTHGISSCFSSSSSSSSLTLFILKISLTWRWLSLAWNNRHTGRALEKTRRASQDWAFRSCGASLGWAPFWWARHYWAHIFHCQPFRGFTWPPLFFKVCPPLLTEFKDLVWALLGPHLS